MCRKNKFVNFSKEELVCSVCHNSVKLETPNYYNGKEFTHVECYPEDKTKCLNKVNR